MHFPSDIKAHISSKFSVIFLQPWDSFLQNASCTTRSVNPVNLTAEPTSYAERWTPAPDEGFSHTWRLLISKQPPGDGAAPWWRLVPSKPPQVKWLNLLHDELSPLVAAQGLGKVGESCVLIQLGEVMRECRCLLAPRS